MKPVLTAAMVAVTTLMLGAMLVLTCSAPSSSPAPFNALSTDWKTDWNYVLSQPKPICLGQPSIPPPLQPGSDQTFSPSSSIVPKDRIFAFSEPVPPPLDMLPRPPHLWPGAYQTYPWTIILVVPGGGIDDRILAEPPNANSKMPVVKPELKAVPKAK